jgi:pimeloyl-ACP methyl ester carboxylesterase
MATFLICHGAWSAAWAWKKVRPLLRAAGHEVFTPTYTGLGERAHQASRSITLDTHIADVLGVIECEDLKDIVLVGHSYGGMVATGVADRVPDRIAKLVYLDAFAPEHGQCLHDLVSEGHRAQQLEGAGRWLAGAAQCSAARYLA